MLCFRRATSRCRRRRPERDASCEVVRRLQVSVAFRERCRWTTTWLLHGLRRRSLAVGSRGGGEEAPQRRMEEAPQRRGGEELGSGQRGGSAAPRRREEAPRRRGGSAAPRRRGAWQRPTRRLRRRRPRTRRPTVRRFTQLAPTARRPMRWGVHCTPAQARRCASGDLHQMRSHAKMAGPHG